MPENWKQASAPMDVSPIFPQENTEAFRIIHNGRVIIIEASGVFSGGRVLPYHVFIVNTSGVMLPGTINHRPVDILPDQAYLVKAWDRAESALDTLLPRPVYFVSVLPIDGNPLARSKERDVPFYPDPLCFQLLAFLSRTPHSREMVRVRHINEELLFQLLLHPYGQVLSESQGHELVLQLERVISLIQQEFHTELSIKDLAKEACMSESHFISRFRRYTGSSPHQFLTEYRVHKARHLIALSGLTLTEIAFTCGFGSYSRFHSAFKSYTGESPTQFRTRLSEQNSVPIIKQ